MRKLLVLAALVALSSRPINAQSDAMPRAAVHVAHSHGDAWRERRNVGHGIRSAFAATWESPGLRISFCRRRCGADLLRGFQYRQEFPAQYHWRRRIPQPACDLSQLECGGAVVRIRGRGLEIVAKTEIEREPRMDTEVILDESARVPEIVQRGSVTFHS